MFDIPILFLIFNRLDTATKVFEQIKKIKPHILYIAADGPRPEIIGEMKKCDEVKTSILNKIDWDCKVSTLFRVENIGCKNAISSAISWFFNHVEMGIILEDDCVPDLSFFRYCEKMLYSYADDERVMMISGTNYLLGEDIPGESYFFSRYFAIWGWATWKRAWKKYDIKMTQWQTLRKIENLKYLTGYSEIAKFYQAMLDVAYSNQIDTWDLQWVYSCLANNGLAIVPVNNLISNVGISGTHTDGKVSKFINMPTKPFPEKIIMDAPLVIPIAGNDKKCFTNIGLEFIQDRINRTNPLRLLARFLIRGNR